MNFYLEKLDNIKKLISEDKIDKAYQIINEELDMPYIPTEFENQFIDLKKECEEVMSKSSTKITSFSLEDIEKVLESDNSLNPEVEVFALDYLRDLNVRKILSKVKSFISNKEKSNSIKLVLISILKEQNIDESIVYINDNGEYNINPIECDLDYFQLLIKNILKNVENKIGHISPDVSRVCKYVLEAFVFNKFPDKLENIKENSEFVLALILFSNEILGDQFQRSELLGDLDSIEENKYIEYKNELDKYIN